MNKWVLIFISIFLGILLHSPKGTSKTITKEITLDFFERLDPHGDTTVPTLNTESKKCSVCHTFQNGKISVRPQPEKTCFLCHNQSPHSGALDHLGKTTSDHKIITCLSCHSPHRWEGKDWEAPGSFWSPKNKNQPQNPKDLSETWTVHHKKNSMITKTCSECHKW